MTTANERRRQILDVISDRRFVKAKDLAEEFGVTERTIRTDIEILSCSAPIQMVQGKCGGIRAADGWYSSRRYLAPQQEALLASLYPGLQPEQQKVMESILAAFAKPKI